MLPNFKSIFLQLLYRSHIAETNETLIFILRGSGQMMTDDSLAEKTLTKSATYWYLEASNVSSVEKCTSVCTAETIGLTSNTDGESPLQNLHQKRSREPNKLNSRGKDVSNSGQSSNAHSTPRTPPISERSVKRLQCQEDTSNKNLQLSMSKKTRWSEKVHSRCLIHFLSLSYIRSIKNKFGARLELVSHRDRMCVGIICLNKCPFLLKSLETS